MLSEEVKRGKSVRDKTQDSDDSALADEIAKNDPTEEEIEKAKNDLKPL